ncbi:MAG TPA: hypothetical protein VIG90_07810 [Pedomonas sp.]|uniref:hypothetical protein n=1 Tax=Pedomonas sp. TaxID=2976421 RepID=UPI002F3FB42B
MLTSLTDGPGDGLTHDPSAQWRLQQIEHNAEWMRDFWGVKHTLLHDPDSPGGPPALTPLKVEPHWYVLKHLARWSHAQYEAAPQDVIDRAVAEILGISLTHAVLMRLGVENSRPIWPDTLIERDGRYPWAALEIHFFWSRLDALSEAEWGEISAAASLQREHLRQHWREIHQIASVYYSDYHDVIQQAANTAPHRHASGDAQRLAHIKTRATFENLATYVAGTHVPCRYLALFSPKSAAS